MIKRIKLGLNDVIVIRQDNTKTSEEFWAIINHIQAVLSDRRIMVLPSDMNIEIWSDEFDFQE